MLDANEISRLAAMGQALRPEWQARSLRTFLERNLAGRTFGDVAVALAWVCTRTRSETPRLLLESGPWWRAAGTENATGVRPPTRDEACEVCGRREPDHEGPHAEHPFVRVGSKPRGRSAAGATLVRTTLAMARARLCVHGIDPIVCTECRHNSEPEEGIDA